MADADRLFDLDGIPEVPIFREPRRAKAARGATLDARFKNDYPPSWHRCEGCGGTGWAVLAADQRVVPFVVAGVTRGDCKRCEAMGSLKAMTRLLAGHRCERCRHPYIPKGDAEILGVEPTPFQWSPCGGECTHGGPVRLREVCDEVSDWGYFDDLGGMVTPGELIAGGGEAGAIKIEAEWRILTVHHLDGDKANCRWWNLAALCQRCHLEIQAKVVLERVYPHEHTEWFRPHAAGWYAFAYLGEDLTREQTLGRLDKLLDLERIA